MYILHYWQVCYTHRSFPAVSGGSRVHTCVFGARANTGGQAFSSSSLSLTRAYGGSAHFAAGCRQGFFVVGGNKILRVTGHHIRGQRLSMPIFVCKRRPHGFVSNGHGHSMWLGVVAWTLVSCCSRQQFNDLFHYDRQKT